MDKPKMPPGILEIFKRAGATKEELDYFEVDTTKEVIESKFGEVTVKTPFDTEGVKK